jgi:transketolase
MGISKAKGMALAGRALGRPRRVFVLTGDGELQEGQFWESLPTAVHLGLGEIVAIIDHNKIQSDTWVRDVNDLGDLEAKLLAFGWHVSRCDGHDVAGFERVLRNLDTVTDRPKVIIADTVKGRGVSFMEGPAALASSDLYLFHSGAPPEQQYLDGVAELEAQATACLGRLGLDAPVTEVRQRNPRREPRATDNLVAAYGKALVDQARRHPSVLALDADLIKDCGLLEFAATFPERFIECGIAEQDMVSMACGIARRGALPVVHSFACFLSARPNEQIYNQCSESTRVIYVGSLAGLLPGGPGHSHQCVRDISALGAIPHLVMVEPSSEAEVAAIMPVLVEDMRESAYLRLVSVKWPMPFAYAGGSPTVGRGWVVREGADVVLFGYGPWPLANAWHASEALALEGIGVRVVNLPWLNRVDETWLREVIGSRRTIVTLDNHYVRGGQGEMLAASVARLGLGPDARVTSIGVDALPECGTNDEVLAYHGLDVDGLVRRVRQAVPQIA